ncbi:MAG: MBOAT family protein [candidate division Zixibacteria bacterium]|nr:MBOAT family protein [candidate division Zixibacteria bacterium]
MLFNSLHYLVFFPVVVAIYFSIPHRYRWILLLSASYYFYMCWKAEYLFLILISTAIDYFCGLQMGKRVKRESRRKFLILSLFTNLGLLFSFKYFNFFNDSMRDLFNQFNIFYNIPAFDVLLPVGISFYTFQTLSYTIDVYRGVKKPERHPGIFAVYVAFFPQLVAGPIERSVRLMPQFYEQKSFDYQRVTDGLKIMVWGFIKKLVIADHLAMYVNQIYNNPGNYTGMPLLLATYFFAFQIYCDFSGYSDIAIGSAKVMGYDLMQNFRRPYFSRSISEFWKRWHISLSSWFRDYLYIPLGGNRVAKWRWYYNLLVVFIVSGFWHGANWTFLFWGALHGSYLVLSIITAKIRYRIVSFLGLVNTPILHKVIKVVITFHLALFAWVFFRANSISDAFLILGSMFRGGANWFKPGPKIDGFDINLAIISILVMEAIQLYQERASVLEFINSKPVLIRWAIYYVAVMVILLFGTFEEVEFIYFQF